MSKKVQGVPIEVDFGRSITTFFIHPDGALNEDSIETSLKIENMQTAARMLAKIQKQMKAGRLDEEEYQAELEKLNRQKEEAIAKLNQPDNDTTLEDIETQYKAACDLLLNARDGKAVSFEEYERLEKESAQWYKKTLYKPFAVPYLRSCVLDWTLYETDEDETADNRLPVTIDNLNKLSEDQIKLAFVKISTYYRKDEEKEKKPIEISPSPSPTTTEQSAESRNGFRSLELPEPTELTLTRLPDGDNESLTGRLPS
jgi:hypothetical protein